MEKHGQKCYLFPTNLKDKDNCKKKGCGQPKGQSCKNPNVHKTWCKSGRDHDGDGDGDDNDDSPSLANTGA